MSTSLFEAERHIKIQAEPWSEERARAAIQEIAQAALEGFFDGRVWSPNEGRFPTQNLYTGASGVLWAIDFLGFSHLLQPTKEELIHRIYRAYLAHPDEREYPASYFLGESGVLALLLKWAPTPRLKERLFQLIQESFANEAIEVFWGAPGTMLIALHLFWQTQEERWLSLYQEGAARLLAACEYVEERRLWYWPSKEGLYIGAAHGTAGCFFSLLAGASFLSKEAQEQIFSRCVESFLSLASCEEGRVNWRATISGPGSTRYLVQWCHGAPGVVSSLSLVPVGYSPAFDDLLWGAGELIWEAGPLEKGVNLCHGTAGNGYAFLALFARDQDPRWLTRARAFAMMALSQREAAPRIQRESLWTEEIGLACFLNDCLTGRGGLPLLERF